MTPTDTLIPGVQTVSPPASIMEAATQMVNDAFARLPADRSGAFIPIVTCRDGKLSANAAVVHRVGEHTRIVMWVGKQWGEPVEAGVAGVVSW